MRIRFIRTLGTDRAAFRAGREYDVDGPEGRRFVAAGLAVELPAPTPAGPDDDAEATIQGLRDELADLSRERDALADEVKRLKAAAAAAGKKGK